MNDPHRKNVPSVILRVAALFAWAVIAVTNVVAPRIAYASVPAISVQKAVFGLTFDPKRQTDVTAVVKKQLSSGETTYKVDYNRLGLKKDPAFGIRKQLRVTYIQGHITKTATTYDGLVMDFNPKPVVFTDAKGDKIVIVKGTYGDLAHPARCIDVTSALIDSASKPKGFPIAKFDRNYVGNEDPAVFFVKSARIDYTVNGKHATKTIKEGDRLDF